MESNVKCSYKDLCANDILDKFLYELGHKGLDLVVSGDYEYYLLGAKVKLHNTKLCIECNRLDRYSVSKVVEDVLKGFSKFSINCIHTFDDSLVDKYFISSDCNDVSILLTVMNYRHTYDEYNMSEVYIGDSISIRVRGYDTFLADALYEMVSSKDFSNAGLFYSLFEQTETTYETVSDEFCKEYYLGDEPKFNDIMKIVYYGYKDKYEYVHNCPVISNDPYVCSRIIYELLFLIWNKEK